MLGRTWLWAAALIVSASAAAQVPNPDPAPEAAQDRGYDIQTPKHDAVDAQEKPMTRALNSEVEQGTTAQAALSAADQAQYDADLAAYDQDVRAHRREVMADRARYRHQQRAYADAMAVWRAQTDACNRGKLKACKLPTPNPADYY